MVPQSIQIINSQLCIGFQSEFALYSLGKETAPIALLQPDRDRSLQFLTTDPINALMAVQSTIDEYLIFKPVELNGSVDTRLLELLG